MIPSPKATTIEFSGSSFVGATDESRNVTITNISTLGTIKVQVLLNGVVQPTIWSTNSGTGLISQFFGTTTKYVTVVKRISPVGTKIVIRNIGAFSYTDSAALTVV